MTADQQSAGVAELQSLAGNRPDLLAQHAGIMLAGADRESDVIADAYRLRAQLCVLAGADESLIPHWHAIGRQRFGLEPYKPDL
jgi:hypothetical protein